MVEESLTSQRVVLSKDFLIDKFSFGVKLDLDLFQIDPMSEILSAEESALKPEFMESTDVEPRDGKIQNFNQKGKNKDRGDRGGDRR